MEELYRQLVKLNESDFYPFHMPGHKRNIRGNPLECVYGVDITEIDGFDNLHRPTEILKEMQNTVASIYDVDESFFLVNGSTCGLQSAISCCIKKNEKLLMARNCHKAVYNTCYIRGIEAKYLYPNKTDEPWIYGSINPENVEQQLRKDSDIKAVLITSPNYDGVVSDIREIADVVHRYDAVLIVDEAHGAHFPYSSLFPESAISCGADLVIQSLHKTLPSLTQTAILHVKGNRVDRQRLRQFLAIYQTSSPSYVFLATMEYCIKNTFENRNTLFQTLSHRVDRFVNNTSILKNLRVLSKKWALSNGIYDFDKCKIIVSTSNCILNGEQIYEILLKRYHLQMEMASKDYVLGIASICDSEEGFRRLEKALFEIDSLCDKGVDAVVNAFPFIKVVEKKAPFCLENVEALCQKRIEETKVFPIHEALEKEKEKRTLAYAKGCVSGEFVYLYPPGVPMIVPGERITGEFIKLCKQCMELGLPLQGMEDMSCESIVVLKEY